MNKEENQVENGEIEIFNDRNLLIWKGEMRNGKEWNGKGFFEWKDKNGNNWECEGTKTVFF